MGIIIDRYMNILLFFNRQNKQSNRLYFQLTIVILLLILSIYFRLTNLEEKIIWVDEISTITRVAGYSRQEIVEDLIDRDFSDIGDLQKYQQLSRKKTFGDTLNALEGSPEHAPLYFLLARLWMSCWGSSIVRLRSLSVIFSLLILPCLYWLCRELFNRAKISWLAVMLMCVSPFYVAYAQEARPYSLWAMTILAMSASFLRAIRINNWQAWSLYIFCLLLGFYTSLLSLLIALFQGCYLLVLNSPISRKVIYKYIICLSLSLLLFSPWLVVIGKNYHLLHDNTFWMRSYFNFANIFAVWIGTILLLFGDLPLSPEADPLKIVIVLISTISLSILLSILVFNWQNFTKAKQSKISSIGLGSIALCFPIIRYFLPKDAFLDRVTFIGTVVAVFILMLAIYSIYFLITHTVRDRWLFIVCLIISVPLPLLLADIINRGQSSATPRYLIPLQLGVEIAAAYTIGINLETNLKIRRQIWKMILIMFIVLGIFSSTRNLNLSPLYLKGRNIHNIPIAKIIDRAKSTLILVEPIEIMDALSLGHYLEPKVKLKILDSSIDFNNYLDRFSNIFILKPSLNLKERLKLNSQIKFDRVYQPRLFSPDEVILELWQIKTLKE